MAFRLHAHFQGSFTTPSSKNLFILPSQPPWEVEITNHQGTGERRKPDTSCDLLWSAMTRTQISLNSNPMFPMDSLFGVNP